jgi:hypothetical protein
MRRKWLPSVSKTVNPARRDSARANDTFFRRSTVANWATDLGRAGWCSWSMNQGRAMATEELIVTLKYPAPSSP